MSSFHYIKLKAENKPGKKILLPNNFDELLEKINKTYLPNNDPNKIYQILDIKFQKIIKDSNDYQSFIINHASDNNVSLMINLIDKNSIDIKKIPDYQLESSSIFFKSNIISKSEDLKKEEEKEQKEEKELTEEEKIKESIRLLVQNKLKDLENNIMSQIISKNINSKSIINNQKYVIHKGIKCNECGMNDIIGIRYKCSKCPNYNLCENCEENTEHDENHMFVKIREPVYEENQLNKTIYQSMLNITKKKEEKERGKDFTTDINTFHFKKDNLINVQSITLKNNGNFIWKKGTIFKCIKEKSSLVGMDAVIEEEIKPGDSVKLELVYEEEIDFSKENFYSCYKLIDNKDNQIGNIHKFDIKIS